MFGNDRRMSQELDNYITGHYGEDQFSDEEYAAMREMDLDDSGNNPALDDIGCK